MQTDSIFTLLSCIYYSEFSTILSGPMANFAGFNNELLVSKLIEPDSETAIGIMMPSGRQLTIVQETAISLLNLQSGKNFREDFKSIKVLNFFAIYFHRVYMYIQKTFRFI